MNVNEKIMKLKEVTGVEVEPDVYSGNSDKYIVFTLEDERVESFGDNKALRDTAKIQVKLYTSKNFNYIKLKHKIRNYLENVGFSVFISSWVEEIKNGNAEYIRTTAFDCKITEKRESEEIK